MFKFLFYVLATSLAVVVSLTFATSIFPTNPYADSYSKATKSPPTLRVVNDVQFTDTDQHPLTKLKMGTTVIMHQSVLRHKSDCFAIYVISFRIKGKEYHQFAPRYTTVLVDRDTVLDIPVDLDLPKDMTPGVYTISETSFPTCDSFSMPPYDNGLNQTIEVTR